MGEGPIEGPADQPATETGAADAIEAEVRTLHDRLGCELAAADCGSNTLAHITRGETRRVAGQKRVADARDIQRTADVVAVAGGIAGHSDPKLPLHFGCKMLPMYPDVLAALLQTRCHGTHPDVQPAGGFGHVPAVTGQSMFEKPQVAIRVLPVMGKFEFQRHGLQRPRPRHYSVEQRTAHRTGRAACADQVAAAERTIDHKMIVAPVNLFDAV